MNRVEYSNIDAIHEDLLAEYKTIKNVRIDVSPLSALRLSLGYQHIERSKVEGERADAVSNLYLSANYEVFENIVIYARLNNLLNKDYQYYEGCPAQGINFLGGVSFRF